MKRPTADSTLLQTNQVNFTDRAVVGTVRRLTFRNEQNGYFVARLEIPGNKAEYTVVGVAPQISEGEQLEADGKWEISKFGRQFKAKTVKLSAPVDEAGLVKFLAGALKGIGPTYAAKLVKAFGTKVGDVISEHPEKLSLVPGIGTKRAKKIIEAWGQRGDNANMLTWLCGIGLSLNFAQRIHERFGNRTKRLISNNPYLLATEIRGIGFLKADAIGRRLGIAISNPFRIQAALLHVMRSATDSGSCGLPREELIESARKLLDFESKADRLEIIRNELVTLIKDDSLAEDISHNASCLFLKSIYLAEREIAQIIVDRLQVPKSRVENLQGLLQQIEAELGLSLETTQRAAVTQALEENLSVITGGPGTGKTTITRAIVAALERRGKVLVCAPTGKAAKRASETIGVDARTIHRTLEWKPNGPQRNEENPLECDALICDELSMVDVPLFRAMLKAVPSHAKVVLVGDADQLPSVGPGKVLTDLIGSGIVPVTRLTEVFRQAQQSKIIANAHKVNHGGCPELGWEPESDFGFQVFEMAQEAENALLMSARDIWKRGFDPIKDVQVLAPMRNGVLGVDSLNTKLQQILNPLPPVSMPFQKGTLGVGDKVIQLRNNYSKEIFNGEIGYVQDLDPTNRTVILDVDGRTVTYLAGELSEICLAYAFTIHRSQGSEFPCVLMGLAWQHYMMLKRNLLYTGMTRARKLMLLFGSARAASRAARDSQIEERYSKLREWLAEAHRIHAK